MTDDLDTPLYIRCSFRSLKPMLGVVCDSMGGVGAGGGGGGADGRGEGVLSYYPSLGIKARPTRLLLGNQPCYGRPLKTTSGRLRVVCLPPLSAWVVGLGWGVIWVLKGLRPPNSL